ncbi:MAG: sigma-70 family RNA polymerase sigma factor, partial [Ornithinibacter sp.]
DGDEGAFAALWRDVNPALIRYLILAGEPADDVASEVWTTVVKGLRRFQGDETAWRAWVFTTARRRAVDVGRRRSRQLNREKTWRARTAMDDAVVDPADLAVQRLDTDAALALVARLSPGQAEVIALRVIAGLSVEEVARILGRSPGSVRVTHHRALQKLRQLLAGPGVTDPEADALYRTT